MAFSKWQLRQAFSKYIDDFGKEYLTAEEYEMRFRHFAANYREVTKINLNPFGRDPVRVALNYFSDWTDDEYQGLALMKEFVPLPQNYSYPGQDEEEEDEASEVSEASEPSTPSDEDLAQVGDGEADEAIVASDDSKNRRLLQESTSVPSINWVAAGKVGPVRS